MIQARIEELKALAEKPFNVVLDVDVERKNRDGFTLGKETRSFVPLDEAAVLREALFEAMRGLSHYRDSLKARILSDSAFLASDLGRIDLESPNFGAFRDESGETGPNHAK